MDIVVTSVIGIFFYNLFLQPILIHSPHFRTMYQEYDDTFNFLIGGSFFVGVNFIRLIYCRVFGLRLTWNDFNQQFFFVKPLNNMSNFTAILTAIQFLLNFVVLFEFPLGEDAWILGIFGMVFNSILIMFQLVRYFQSRRFFRKYQKLKELAEAETPGKTPTKK
jgi:hypothetical protein